VHITVTCPSCFSRYQLDPGLRGQRMRCPNPTCREVFEVRADEAPAGPAVDAYQPEDALVEVPPHAEGLIPLEEAAGTSTTDAPAPSEAEDELPILPVVPPARKAPAPEPRRVKKEVRPSPPTAPARPSWESPPPVRRAAEPGSPISADEPRPGPVEAAAEAADEEDSPKPPRRHALWIMAVMVVVGGIAIAGTAMVALNAFLQNENRAREQAEKDYGEHKFETAAKEFEQLAGDYPNSDKLDTYHFMEELSHLRGRVQETRGDPKETYAALLAFLQKNRKNADLKAHGADAAEMLLKVADDQTELAAQDHDTALLEQAKKAMVESREFAGTDESPTRAALEKKVDDTGRAIVAWHHHRQVIAQLQRMSVRATVDSLREVRLIIRQEHLEQDAEATQVVAAITAALRATVEYVQQSTPPVTLTNEAAEPSLFVSPRLAGPAKAPDTPGRVMLALSRGVVYGMDLASGRVRWAMRVGVDTETLPVRLPRTAISPELFLVLSADRTTDTYLLTAVKAETGEPYWRHHLSGPCLGKPLLVERRVYVPTYDGRVNEIEIVKGNLLGYFKLGQHLTVGGASQPGTDLAFFPGDSEDVYVLDLGLKQVPGRPAPEKKCVMTLHTGHPAGSLRSEPIVINRVDPFARGQADEAQWPGYLILTQTDGLHDMKLRAFAVPVTAPDASPILQPEPRIPGWSWFRPYYDDEKLAFVTDTGALGLFGINQIRNEDRPLFPMFRTEQSVSESGEQPGRAQVVHAAENDFWILAKGELRRYHLDLYRQKMVPLWSAPAALGSPLHAAQFDEATKTLVLVTQDPFRQVELATALDAETGTIRWQRQLGLDTPSAPLVINDDIYTADRGGGLFACKRPPAADGQMKEWPVADTSVTEPLAAGSQVRTFLMKGPEVGSVYQFAASADGHLLRVRRYPGGQATLDLTSSLAARPAFTNTSLMLMLANGSMERFRLPLDGSMGQGGPDWRSSSADEGAGGFVVALGGDEFLATDGSRGLTHWRWPAEGTFQTVPEGRTPTVELPARVISAPVVLPAEGNAGNLRVCVADAAGTVTLLAGANLEPTRSWTTGGKISAGPFVLGEQVLCVVDRHRLYCIDPDKEQRLWEASVMGDGIVGEPQKIGDLIVIADQSGHFIGLNPATGKPTGNGYVLKASAAPATSPVAYADGKALVILTDGTVFLLDLASLQQSAKPPKTP
jgi:outer membrane protein assembly factor BamB